MEALLSEDVKQSWKEVMAAEGAPVIESSTVRHNTMMVLENTKREMAKTQLDEAVTTSAVAGGTAASGYDPTLISMIRRTMPSLIANDTVGVQPMTGPTGLIFAETANITDAAGTVTTDFFGNPIGSNTAVADTATAEALGVAKQADAAAAGLTPVVEAAPWAEVDFDITKVQVTAKARALKAKYTIEMADDLRAIHGADAEAILSSYMSGAMISEQNREITDLISNQAILSNAADWAGLTANTFRTVTDADGRWQAEQFQSLYTQICFQASAIAQGTRQGAGNFLIVSPKVAVALESVAKLVAGGSDGGLVTKDFIGTTYAGVLGGRFKLFIDAYATTDFVTIGFKGSNEMQAGIFYAPYIPATWMKATNSDSLQPVIGVKSRYGMAIHPREAQAGVGANRFYRKFVVTFD